ncbi:hypothetical protein BDM02DRAFT_3132047 [Thelephora ganbajun]|uniref:Uncharacterized protein n=1 Tax=Thelephora ganbajun TaxID=370292 RepID=A0ACB6Z379_THEGA|nr:hypothetical protein BDM02DRAFT_3132047 [Thelephora ganbajun]
MESDGPGGVVVESGTDDVHLDELQNLYDFYTLQSLLTGSHTSHFFVVPPEPSIAVDYVEGGEDVSSPMFMVVGLNFKDLEHHVTVTNKYIPAMSSPARFTLFMVSLLLSAKSALPFSKHKPAFHARFLLTNVPFHIPHLVDAIYVLLNHDSRDEELWRAGKLHIPVYYTVDGSDLRSSVTSALVEPMVLAHRPPCPERKGCTSFVKAGFTSAVLPPGYHVKLAGRGHYNPTAIDPHRFTFQLPPWQEMYREGSPIEGFYISFWH